MNVKVNFRNNVCYISNEQVRPLVIVDITNEYKETYSVVFYKSTGINSGVKGKWFPILGIFNEQFLAVHEIKGILDVFLH